MKDIYLGDTVLFRAPKKHGETESVDYPGIIYKIYKDEPGKYLGLLVIFDGMPSRYGKVAYDEKEENCWRYVDRI